MKFPTLAVVLGLATLIGASSSSVAQSIRPASVEVRAAPLTLRGLDGVDHRVTPAELASFRRVDTTVAAHQVTGRYRGVLLTDVLSLVHAPSGDSLRGKALAAYILVVAADGYRVVFALADFAPGFTDRIAILADTVNGAPLPSSEGAFHLIIPGEKRPARWVRQVVRIEVRDAP